MRDLPQTEDPQADLPGKCDLLDLKGPIRWRQSKRCHRDRRGGWAIFGENGVAADGVGEPMIAWLVEKLWFARCAHPSRYVALRPPRRRTIDDAVDNVRYCNLCGCGGSAAKNNGEDRIRFGANRRSP